MKRLLVSLFLLLGGGAISTAQTFYDIATGGLFYKIINEESREVEVCRELEEPKTENGPLYEHIPEGDIHIPAEITTDAFDWKLLIKQVNLLRSGESIEQPTYSYLKCNRLPETIHVDPKPVIIIEGIMTLLNKRLREMMDLKVFVDCDSDERLIRNIQRDIVERGRDVSMVVNRYLEVLKPMHEQFIEPTKRFADVIIPQGGDNIKGIDILSKYVERLVLMG